ncbi:MAG: hypothetical protein NT018_04205 [Armatimonadetes bacterium]|nr:hypothetical protein [Armatimonadota bacterium]
MQHNDHEIFVNAIHGKNKLIVTFFSKEDRSQLVRTCAPFDFAASTRAKDKTPRYHFWDYDSDKERHTLSLLSDQIIKMELINETFDPADIVKWSPTWTLPRNWGQYS